MHVYILHHIRELDDGAEEVKLIGVYSEPQLAENACVELRKQPGFKDWPSGFETSKHELDATQWREGFVTDDE